MRYYS